MIVIDLLALGGLGALALLVVGSLLAQPGRGPEPYHRAKARDLKR